MSKIPIGVQLYSVREDCARDLPGTLEAIAKMGYDGVEFAGYYDYSAEALKKLLDDNVLRCCGTHIQLDTLLGDALEGTIEFNKVIGNRYLVVPWIPEERRDSLAGWKATAGVFNEIADKLAPHGMLTGYHNHGVEFEPVEGSTGFEAFYSTAREDVIMQIDIGNAMHGGGDPIDFMRRYPKNLVTVHLKEYSASNPKALVGEGDVPWTEVFEICEGPGSTEWYIVEQESYAVPPLESIDRCLQALRGMGK
jgi:sugar phosphate isomerase/epimerase